MIDSLLDYPCVAAQPRASLMRGGTAHSTCAAPFQNTDDKPSIHQRICDTHCQSRVMGAVFPTAEYISQVFPGLFLRAEGNVELVLRREPEQ